jgi:hypothetical protein
MSRPRKRKADPPARTSPPDEETAAWSRQHNLNALRVDPKGDDPLACVLASVVLDRSFPSVDEVAGAMFVAVLKNPDPMVAGRFFQRVMRLKLNADMPHRNAYAFHAYGRFIEETGREPSKPELRAYIEARRNEFKDAPGAEDPKGWTRLWRESGLSGLATR